MNPEAFRYFLVFPLTVRPHARTEDGNNLLHSELLFKINYCITTRYPSTVYRVVDTDLRAKALSVCSKLVPSAIQVLRSFPEDECTCMRYTLKPPKGTQPFKYMIAQFRSNMELTLVGEAVTVCINTEEINLIVDSVPKSIKADLIKGVLTIKIGCDCDRLSGHYKRGD